MDRRTNWPLIKTNFAFKKVAGIKATIYKALFGFTISVSRNKALPIS